MTYVYVIHTVWCIVLFIWFTELFICIMRGFCVARSDKMGNARAFSVGRVNRIPRFFI